MCAYELLSKIKFYERVHHSTDHGRHLSKFIFFSLHARPIEHVKKLRNPNYLVLKLFPSEDTGQTTLIPEGTFTFLVFLRCFFDHDT